MPNMSDALENTVVDGLFRGGALTSAGVAGPATVVNKGIWTATTAYVVGDKVVPHANMTGAGGKFLVCTTAGTSGSTNTLALGNPGTTVTDNAIAIWTVVSGIPSPLAYFAALFTANKGLRLNSTAYAVGDVVSVTATGGTGGSNGGDTKQHLYRVSAQTGNSAAAQGTVFIGIPGESVTDNLVTWIEIGPVFDSNTGFPAGLAEVAGGSYARVRLSAAAIQQLADWAGTQASLSTTVSTGSGGTTSNNAIVTFAAPTANWAVGPSMVAGLAIYDQLAGGTLQFWSALSIPKSVNNGDAAPTIAASALTIQMDN